MTVEELCVGSADELTGGAFALCFMAKFALLIVEVLVTLGAFHFASEEDTHDGTYGCPVLNTLQNRVELGGGGNSNHGQSIGEHDAACYN